MTTKITQESSSKPTIVDGFSSVLDTLGSFRSQITVLQNQIRTLEKVVRKQVKSLQKEASKGKKKGNRKPSGFAVPTKISNELCDFMKRPRGSEVARTEVTQFMIKYIKEKKLQNSQNRKVIRPNKALKSLLAVEKNDEVTYFNLQKYMNKHFLKNNQTKKKT